MNALVTSGLCILLLTSACLGDDTTIRPSTRLSASGATESAAGRGAVPMPTVVAGSVATQPTAAGATAAASVPPPIKTPQQPAAAPSEASAPSTPSEPPAPPASGASSPETTAPPAPSGPSTPSTGCGAGMPPPPSGNQSMEVMGTKRDFIAKIPATYDAKKPYKLIFAWHGLGGSAMQIAGGFGGGYYGQAQRFGDGAIYIAGQGLPTSSGMDGMEGGAGWPNTGGRDAAFVRDGRCVSRDRITACR